ncbi:hypothetical protein LZ32DRAFT_456212 [Colletotrichum eremochloae]|nr:hypothetical protein LZ32DRAFT_456212 [Colletotrichum eremochloae]
MMRMMLLLLFGAGRCSTTHRARNTQARKGKREEESRRRHWETRSGGPWEIRGKKLEGTAGQTWVQPIIEVRLYSSPWTFTLTQVRY